MRPPQTSTMILYLCLLLTAAWLLAQPIKALADGSRSTTCAGGTTVSCPSAATNCSCSENNGCTQTDSQGNVIKEYPCPSDTPLYLQ